MQIWRRHDCATWGLYLAFGSIINMPGEERQISGFLCASVSLLDSGSDDTADFSPAGVFWSV